MSSECFSQKNILEKQKSFVKTTNDLLGQLGPHGGLRSPGIDARGDLRHKVGKTSLPPSPGLTSSSLSPHLDCMELFPIQLSATIVFRSQNSQPKEKVPFVLHP